MYDNLSANEACHNMFFDASGHCVDYAVLVFEFLSLPARIKEGLEMLGPFMIPTLMCASISVLLVLCTVLKSTSGITRLSSTGNLG